MKTEESKAKGYVASYAHVAIWGISVITLGATLWVQVNFPSRGEFRENAKEMMLKIDNIMTVVNQNAVQMAIVVERQNRNTQLINDLEKQLKNMEGRLQFVPPLPNLEYQKKP